MGVDFGMLTIIIWLSGLHMGSHDFKLIMIIFGLIQNVLFSHDPNFFNSLSHYSNTPFTLMCHLISSNYKWRKLLRGR